MHSNGVSTFRLTCAFTNHNHLQALIKPTFVASETLSREKVPFHPSVASPKALRVQTLILSFSLSSMIIQGSPTALRHIRAGQDQSDQGACNCMCACVPPATPGTQVHRCRRNTTPTISTYLHLFQNVKVCMKYNLILFPKHIEFTIASYSQIKRNKEEGLPLQSFLFEISPSRWFSRAA